MIESTINKSLATSVSLSIALAFFITTKTHATTQFPQQRTAAQFNEQHDVNDTKVTGSYGHPNVAHDFDVQLRRGNVRLAYSNVRITP